MDLFVAAWLLCAKLIARECENREALVLIFCLQSTQPGVLWREASAAGDVND